MGRGVGVAIAIGWLTIIATPAVSMAQVSEAQRLFEQADLAIDEGRFTEAELLLRRSMALQPHPPTAYNLALVLRAMGRVTESLATVEELLAGRHGPVPEARRSGPETLARELRASLATVTVTVDADVELRVDGEAVASASAGEPLALRLDPREHRIAAFIGSRLVGEQSVDLAEGASVRVGLHGLTPAPASALRDEGELSETEPSETEAIVDSPWFWVALVAGLAAAAVGVTAAVLVLDGQGASDPVWPTGVTLLAY